MIFHFSLTKLQADRSNLAPNEKSVASPSGRGKSTKYYLTGKTAREQAAIAAADEPQVIDNRCPNISKNLKRCVVRAAAAAAVDVGELFQRLTHAPVLCCCASTGRGSCSSRTGGTSTEWANGREPCPDAQRVPPRRSKRHRPCLDIRVSKHPHQGNS